MLIVFAEKKSSCQLCLEHVMRGKLPSRRGQKATNADVGQYHQRELGLAVLAPS